MAAVRHLIIGGGIIGCSIAYHLARRGETGIAVLEKSALTEGATWHAAGLVGQLRSSRNTTRMLQKSVALYQQLEAETGQAIDWKQVGSLRLACSPERMLEMKRLVTMARSFGLEMEVISPSEAAQLFPLIATDKVLGAAFIRDDGQVDPASLCQAIAKGARQRGVKFHQGAKVLDFEHRNGCITRVLTNGDDYSADNIVLTAGMWSRELGARLGLKIPACALEHQYMVTEPVPGIPDDLPTLRDPDRLVYYKQEVGGRLLVGGYESNTNAFGTNGIPGEFTRQLLPENFDRFEPLAANAALVTPVVNDVGIRQLINGPIPYSADGDFVMGPSAEFANLFIATGFLYGIAAAGGAGEMMAEWILEGEPSFDLWPLDSRRFGYHHGAKAFMYPRAVEHYAHHYKLRYPGQESEVARGIRRSPLYELLAAKGAVYGSKNGWERPNWFSPSGADTKVDSDFLKPIGEPHVAREHMTVRERVALIDQTSFSKFELRGPGALDALQRLAVSDLDRPVGTVVYTQLCNARGGIEADLTVTRLEQQAFYIVTGSGFGVHDSHWIRTHLPADGSVILIDVTSAKAVINVCGPNARDLLKLVTEEDVGSSSFPFAAARNITVGSAPVLAIRIGYVGELGWELHIPTEYAAHVYQTLWESGQALGVTNVGYRAIESLRLEKGYLYWSTDITPDYTPLEAGLGGRVQLRRKGDFLGRQALEKAQRVGPTRKLCMFVVDQPIPAQGGESILHNGDVVSVVTSAGYGYTVGKMVLMGYLPRELLAENDYVVEAYCERYPAVRVDGPLYDPDNRRLQG